MKQLTLIVLLFAIVGCLANLSLNDLDSFDEDNEQDEFDQSEYFDESDSFDHPENVADQPDNFDQLNDVDQSEFQAVDNIENDDSEVEVLAGHLKYQDAARAALLQLAAKLRKGKNVTNAFLKVIDRFEKKIAEYQSAIGRRRVKADQISRIEEFIREAVKNRKINTNILRELTAQGIFFSEKLGVKGSVAKRSLDYLLRGATAFLEIVKEDIGETEFEEYLGVNGLITLMFAMDTTGSMRGDIDAAIAISIQIVNETRENDVDYILSPFNDPCKLFLLSNA